MRSLTDATNMLQLVNLTNETRQLPLRRMQPGTRTDDFTVLNTTIATSNHSYNTQTISPLCIPGHACSPVKIRQILTNHGGRIAV